MTAILLKNADLYNPDHVGTKDILVVAGKIIAIDDHLDVSLPDLEIIDATGYKVTPGLIDQHIHVTGGGGEGGWASRCPELMLSELVMTGVTTFMGVSGTDSMSRSIENLLAKVRGLKVEGASGWMWTSNYGYPVTTICKDVKTEMLAIPEVLGVKIAMGDHRSAFPTAQEVLRILADIRVSGMLTGKVGFLHVHLGDFAYSFDIFDECIAKGMPIKHIRPTHVARHPEVFKRACEFAKKGGQIDFTTGGGNYMGTAADAVVAALEDGVPLRMITMSSDGHGSMPRFDDKGEVIGIGVGKIFCNLEELRKLADKIGLEKALLPMTRTVAKGLGLDQKGEVAVGKDADIVLFNDNLEPQYVIMNGRIAMRAGEVVMKGAFED